MTVVPRFLSAGFNTMSLRFNNETERVKDKLIEVN